VIPHFHLMVEISLPIYTSPSSLINPCSIPLISYYKDFITTNQYCFNLKEIVAEKVDELARIKKSHDNVSEVLSSQHSIQCKYWKRIIFIDFNILFYTVIYRMRMIDPLIFKMLIKLKKQSALYLATLRYEDVERGGEKNQLQDFFLASLLSSSSSSLTLWIFF